MTALSSMQAGPMYLPVLWQSKTMTGSGRQFTFEATRSEETGHSDLAWACMHVFVNEPLEGRNNQNSSFMEIS